MSKSRRAPIPTLLAGVASLLVLLLVPPGASAADSPPWKAADAINARLFDAQTELVLDDTGAARADARRAQRAYDGPLARGVKASDPEADAALRAALLEARDAAFDGDDVRLAEARGAIKAALFRGAYTRTAEAAERGDAATARQWLLLREYRTSTRFTRPGADATLAVEQLAARRLSPAATAQAVRKDLLDAYQSRLRELLDDAARGSKERLPVRKAEAAAQAAGYFTILSARYAEDRGAGAERRALAAYRALPAQAATPAAVFDPALRRARAAIDGFTAAPFTDEEAARRAQQLLRFLNLVPVEYGRGVNDTEVTKDFEIQEAVAFRTGAEAAFGDLRDQIAKRDRAAATATERGLAQLRAIVERAQRQKEGVATHGTVEDLTERIVKRLESAMPSKWKAKTDESDYDLIALTLDRMEAAIGAGQYRQAEQARLEAYAFFEFGPERRLKAFDQGLALTVEGLVWFGAEGEDGLAKLIAQRAGRRDIRDTRLLLDEKLNNAAATLGDSANKTTVVTNSAIIVFREGLEGVLILAAITASMVGARRRLRRPVFIGAFLGLLASIFTFILAQTVLTSLDRYGEKLEAVVGLVAIGVLLLITNWFFHKVYWSEWIGKFHRQRKKYEKLERKGFISAQAIGLLVLGLTSVYREGFETVLFLQSLQLSAGTPTVVEGASLGLAATFAVGGVTFYLQRKLPYKKMLIATGVLIGVVLVVMVGQTVRTMQGTGWLPITPIDWDMPYWPQQWLGVYPTWETIGGQIGAAVFVIGSYFLAQEMKVKRPTRRRKKREAGEVATAGAPDVSLSKREKEPAGRA